MEYLAEIPYGCYWSTPFARWQGAYANLPQHSYRKTDESEAQHERRNEDGSDNTNESSQNQAPNPHADPDSDSSLEDIEVLHRDGH